MITKASIKVIHKVVEDLFERMRSRLLGPQLVDKRIAITTDKHLTLPGLYVAAARDDGAEASTMGLHAVLSVAEGYLDAMKERTKAQVVRQVDSFLQDAERQGVDTDLNTVLAGELTKTWGKVTTDMRRIVDSEAQNVRSMGALEGIVKINAQAGIDDPVVYFVIVRDGAVCGECMRLHMLPDRKTPRVWKLSEVGSGYHRKGDSNPKSCGLHPHCRCTMVTLMPGWGFDDDGFAHYISPDHDEYARQRSLKKHQGWSFKKAGDRASEIRATLHDIDQAEQHRTSQHGGQHAHDCPSCKALGHVPSDLGHCTSTALHIAQKHGGKVFGYDAPDFDDPRIGAGEGHDFAVVDGRYLVDWWGKSYEGEQHDLLDLQNPEHQAIARQKYGDPKEWEEVPLKPAPKKR